MTCPARKNDRWLTVHECTLDENHDGYHTDKDGFLFWLGDHVPPARVLISATEVRPENLDQLRDYNPEPSPLFPDTCWVLDIPFPSGAANRRHAWIGECVVVFSDGRTELIGDLEYRRCYSREG